MRLKQSITWLLAASVPLLTACQLFDPPGSSLKSAEHPGFMDLWKVYNHCRTTDDPETLLLDTLLLQRSVHEQPAHDVPKVLQPIRRFIEPTPVRLAADPRAMAATCTLRAGELAMRRGWSDLAMQIYTAMIPAYQAPEYAFYLQQARLGLSEALARETAPGPTASSRRF